MKGKTALLAGVCVAGTLVAGLVHDGDAGLGAEGPLTTDREFFDALLLEGGELAPVKASLAAGDLAGAKRSFVAHLRERTRPRWNFSWKDKPAAAARPLDPSVSEADRYARNELMSIGIWHDFGLDIQWDLNPSATENKEWTFELNRHRFWDRLGRAYWDTGDEKYARAFVAQLRDWVRDNPVPRLIKANYVGSRWRTLEAGIRMSETWPDALQRFLSSPSFGDDDVFLMVKSILEHARYLDRHESRGNILTHEMRGLYTAGALFPEFKEAAAWRAHAFERLNEELDSQVYPDGAQFELTTSYHRIALRNFVSPLTLARRNGYPVPGTYLERLEKMFMYALYASMPNGYLPGLNDANETDVRETLRDGARLFPERRDFLWVATGGQEGAAPAGTSHAFPFAGQLVMRSGWDAEARYLLFDAGPFGHAHQHEDKLNLVIYAHGARLLVDPGNYTYDQSRWRRYVTSSYAHNVVHVDANPQRRGGLLPKEAQARYVVTAPLPYAWATGPGFDYAAASFGALPEEGFGAFREKSVLHTRHVLYVKNAPEYWLVVDALEPRDSRRHSYESLFHLDVLAAIADPRTKRVATLNPERATLAIVPFPDSLSSVEVVKGSESPVVQGWHPTRTSGVDTVRPIPTVIFKSAAKGDQHLVYAFQPVSPVGRPTIAAVTPVQLSRDSLRVRVVHDDGAVDDLQLGGTPGVVRHPGPGKERQ